MAEYDWEAAAENNRSDKMRPGKQKLMVKKIRFQDRDGIRYESKSQHPQILLIYHNEHDEECTDMMTLSDKAAWTLARLLSAMDTDANAQLKKLGVTPADFAAREVAEQWLLPQNQGAAFMADVVYPEGKEYPDIIPFKAVDAADDGPPM